MQFHSTYHANKLQLDENRHGVFIGPHGCVKKFRALPQKLDALCVQTEQYPAKCQSFEQKPLPATLKSIFLHHLNLKTFSMINPHHWKRNSQI